MPTLDIPARRGLHYLDERSLRTPEVRSAARLGMPGLRTIERTSGAVATRLCGCQEKTPLPQQRWMRLLEDGVRRVGQPPATFPILPTATAPMPAPAVAIAPDEQPNMPEAPQPGVAGDRCAAKFDRFAQCEYTDTHSGGLRPPLAGPALMNRQWSTAAVVLSLAGAAGVLRATAEEIPPAFDAAAIEFFEKDVRPLLVKRCYECHGPEAKRLEGNFLMTSRENVLKGGDNGPAVVPGNLEESLLIDAINYGEFFEMPPKGKLPKEEIALLTRWVEMGAPWPRRQRCRSAEEI